MGGICSSISCGNSLTTSSNSSSVRTFFSSTTKASDNSTTSPIKSSTTPYVNINKAKKNLLNTSKESLKGYLNIKRRRRNTKMAEMNKQFENILKFFDLPVHKNLFENVNSIITYFDQNESKEEVSMKLSKIVFDSYDRDKSGFLDSSELRKFCRDLLYMCGQTKVTEKSITSLVESLQNVIRAQKFDRLSFELFWSSNIMRGEMIDSCGQLDESYIVFNPSLSTEQMQFLENLTSRELKKEFDLFFRFFDYRPTGNLLRDINLFMKILADEDFETPSPIFDSKEVSKLQKKLQSRLLRYIFEYYDGDGSGVIERDELLSFMQDVQEALSKNGDEDISEEDISDLVDEMLHDCDVDGDGNISYHEILPHLPALFARMRH